MRSYLTYHLPFLGLLVAAALLSAVMVDSAGYRWCDQYTDPHCVSVYSE